MAVNQDDFPGCCTAIVLTDFGNSHTSEYGFHAYSYQRIRGYVIDQVEEARDEGTGIITAILTSEQTEAKEVLKELGFIGTGEAKKGRHAEVTIELYYLHCKDWNVPEKAVEPPRPRDANGRFLPAQQQAVNPFVAQPMVEPFEPEIVVPEVLWKAKITDEARYFVGVVHRDDSVGVRAYTKLFTTAEKNRLNNSRFNKGFIVLHWFRAN